MARVYQSRGLIDPSMYQLMSNNMNERIRQYRESRRPAVEMLQGAVTTLGSAYDDWSKQKGRDRYLKRVMEENPEFAEYARNPFFKAGMHEFVRTGSASPLMQFLGQENTRKLAEAAAAQRQAEAQQRLAVETERKAREDAIKQATAKGQIDDLLLKASEAYDEGYDDKGNAYVERAQRMADAYGISDFDPEGFKASELAGRDKRKDSRMFRAQIEDDIAKGFHKDSDLLVMRQTVANAYNDGKLTKSDYEKLDEELSGSETVQGQFRKGARDTRVGIQNDQIKKDEEDKQKTIELAKKAQKKLDNKYKLTKSEQDALNKAKEKKWI